MQDKKFKTEIRTQLFLIDVELLLLTVLAHCPSMKRPRELRCGRHSWIATGARKILQGLLASALLQAWAGTVLGASRTAAAFAGVCSGPARRTGASAEAEAARTIRRACILAHGCHECGIRAGKTSCRSSWICVSTPPWNTTKRAKITRIDTTTTTWVTKLLVDRLARASLRSGAGVFLFFGRGGRPEAATRSGRVRPSSRRAVATRRSWRSRRPTVTAECMSLTLARGLNSSDFNI